MDIIRFLALMGLAWLMGKGFENLYVRFPTHPAAMVATVSANDK